MLKLRAAGYVGTTFVVAVLWVGAAVAGLAGIYLVAAVINSPDHWYMLLAALPWLIGGAVLFWLGRRVARAAAAALRRTPHD